MVKPLVDIAHKAYVSDRVRRRQQGSPITALPPFSLGSVNGTQRKHVIRRDVTKEKRRLTKEHLFRDCIHRSSEIPLPVLIELGKIASRLYFKRYPEPDQQGSSVLSGLWAAASKPYIKIGVWDQDAYDPGTGKGNIYAVRHENKEYIVVYDYRGDCVCSIPSQFSSYFTGYDG